MQRLLLLITASFLLQSLTAQEKVFTFKPAIGLNACQIHGDAQSGYRKAGLFAGIAVNAYIADRSSMELGFYFSQKGARKNQNPKIGDYHYFRINLNYIDMPLNFRYRVNKNYFITGGLSIAYLINYQESNENGDWTNVWPFNKFEVSLTCGIGRKINDRIDFELRSVNSIVAVRPYGGNFAGTNVYYSNPIARYFNKGLYNNILTFMFSYRLSSKKSDDK